MRKVAPAYLHRFTPTRTFSRDNITLHHTDPSAVQPLSSQPPMSAAKSSNKHTNYTQEINTRGSLVHTISATFRNTRRTIACVWRTIVAHNCVEDKSDTQKWRRGPQTPQLCKPNQATLQVLSMRPKSNLYNFTWSERKQEEKDRPRLTC